MIPPSALAARLHVAVVDYLEGLHATQWGQAFDIVQRDSKAEAVAFISRLIEGVLDNMDAELVPTWTPEPVARHRGLAPAPGRPFRSAEWPMVLDT